MFHIALMLRALLAAEWFLLFGQINSLTTTGAQSINLHRFKSHLQPDGYVAAVKPAAATFPQYNFTQPLDHFVDTGFTFQQRYWVSDRHYVPGGPVVILDGGETSGADRLTYMDTGIVDILTNATGGLGVVLEHRYYGASVPVQNFSTDSLRWLTNEQAAADSAIFMSNVVFEGIAENLTAPGTPWIYYGGSYAGARSAHMRVLYPDLVYGAIASSGVVEAKLSNWEYYDIIRQFAPANCTTQLERAIVAIDQLLAQPSTRIPIKTFFGLANLTHDVDFASLLTSPVGDWQDNNWDPAVGSTGFARFCNALGDPNDDEVIISQGIKVNSAVERLALYINQTYSSRCPTDQDSCFGTFDPTAYQSDTLEDTWRLWQFQVCTQWGFFFTAPPNPKQPRIVSRLNTLEYASQICQFAYPPGEHFVVPPLPNITAVNALGGYNIAADRLAIIDGQADPWRPDTAHSSDAKNRSDTTLRPFKLIPGAVHHYDENGLANHAAEPAEIQAIHEQEIEFVKAWLRNSS